jgi:hypothetical protein
VTEVAVALFVVYVREQDWFTTAAPLQISSAVWTVRRCHSRTQLIRSCVMNCRFRVFDNRMLKRTFGSKREEVTVDWRKLHNEEFCTLFYSQVIRIRSRRM